MRDFTAQRTAQFSWKLSENGFLSPVIDYNFTTASTLAPMEVDEFGRQRTGNELSKMMIVSNGKLLNLGDDGSHIQNVTINFRPKLPNIWGLNTYLDNTGSYIVKYEWRDPLQPDPTLRDAVKYGTVQSNINLSSRLQLRIMSDKWFGVTYGKTDSTSSFFGTVGKVLDVLFLDFDEIKLTSSKTTFPVIPVSSEGAVLRINGGAFSDSVRIISGDRRQHISSVLSVVRTEDLRFGEVRRFHSLVLIRKKVFVRQILYCRRITTKRRILSSVPVGNYGRTNLNLDLEVAVCLQSKSDRH